MAFASRLAAFLYNRSVCNHSVASRIPTVGFTRKRQEGNDLTQCQSRWLLSHGHDDEAIEVLACIEAMDLDDPYIRTQYDEIKYSIAYESDNAVRWRDLIRRNKTDSTKTLRRLVLGASTQAIQQFQGLSITGHIPSY